MQDAMSQAGLHASINPATVDPASAREPLKSRPKHRVQYRPATFIAMEFRNENANLVLLVGCGRIQT
jgi:hypothetical protein